MMQNSYILVLGGTGYIGEHLCNHLEKYYTNVYKAGRKTLGNEPKFISLDLLDINQAETVFASYNFDYIFNLTGCVHISHDNNEMFDKLIQGNIYTARNLMRAIHTSKIADVKVIHFSTMSVYGAPQYLPVDEEHPVSPVNLYGITKLAGEQMIKYYAQNYNIHSLVLRVPGVFGGKRRGGAIYNFVKNAIINENINIKTTGLKSWSTIYIDTLSTMALQLINDYKWDKLYEIINLSYGENIDIIDTANVIKQKIDSKSQVIVEQPIDYQKFWLSNEKLNNTIEQRYSYDEDLEQYIKVIRES